MIELYNIMSGINWSMYVHTLDKDLKIFKNSEDTNCRECKTKVNIESIPYPQRKFAKIGNWVCSKCYRESVARSVRQNQNPIQNRFKVYENTIPKVVEDIPKIENKVVEDIPKIENKVVEDIPKVENKVEKIKKQSISEIKLEKLNNTINDFIEEYLKKSNISNNNEYLDLWYNKNNQNNLNDFIKNRKIKMKETTEEKKIRILEEREKKQEKTKIKKASKEKKESKKKEKKESKQTKESTEKKDFTKKVSHEKNTNKYNNKDNKYNKNK